MAAKKTKKATQAPAQIPDEVIDLLKDDEADQQANTMQAQGQTMVNAAAFLKYVEMGASDAIEVFSRSGFKGIASHFQQMRDAGRRLTREITIANPCGKLILKDANAPQQFPSTEEPTPAQAESGLTPADED